MYDVRQIAEKRADRKIEFFKNIKAYIIVNGILLAINALFSPDFWWVMFPVFFWGISVLVDFLQAYVLIDDFDSESYRERMVHEEMEKLRN